MTLTNLPKNSVLKAVRYHQNGVEQWQCFFTHTGSSATIHVLGFSSCKNPWTVLHSKNFSWFSAFLREKFHWNALRDIRVDLLLTHLNTYWSTKRGNWLYCNFLWFQFPFDSCSYKVQSSGTRFHHMNHKSFYCIEAYMLTV